MALIAGLAAVALGCGDDAAPEQPDAGRDAGGPDDRDPTQRRDGGTGDAGGSNPSNDAAVDGGDPQPETGTVRGRVFSARSLQAIEGATVRGPGGAATTTDEEGRFTLELAAGRRVVVRVDHEDHARGIEPVAVSEGRETYVEVRLAPIDVRASVDATVGGRVGSGSGASAHVPGNALRTADGDGVSGMVEVALAALDPTHPEELRAFPGDFKATRMDGSEGILETYVPMDITIRQGEEELQLADGMEMVVTFPVFDPDSAPQTIGLWSLDPETGMWREEGTATRMTDEDGNPVYRASIGHMSWWNCDAFIDQVTCIRGCVTFNGEPVRNAWVRARGIDFANEGGGYTGADGCFAEDTKAGARLSIQAEAIEGVSEPLIVTATNALMTAADNPAACQNVGTLELEPRDTSNEACPGGLVTCEGQCVDLLSSPNNCGGCGIPCDASRDGDEGGGVIDASCVAGRCECLPGETICNNRCVDTETDRNHCGGCSSPCPIGTACVGGDCAPIECGDGLTLCGNDCVDTLVDENHCGGCEEYCGLREGGGDVAPSCMAGDCVCPDGFTMCNPETLPICVDLDTDFNHCGDCNDPCSVGQECVAGKCEDIMCEGELSLCGFDCVDTDTDASHCGGCNQGCFDLAAEGSGRTDTFACQAGTCTCTDGFTDCELDDPLMLECRDLTSDRANCGDCGNRCVTGQTCENSACETIACDGGETLCGNECVDPLTDARHCGGCGIACPGQTQCVDGECGCGAGETACHGPTQGSDEAVTDLKCAASTGDCDDVPAESCDDLSGDWALNVCGSPYLTHVRQVGCAFATDSYPYGWFSDASTIEIDIDGNRCTATVTGDTLSGTCDFDEPPCPISGTRPACTEGTNPTVCGGACRDLDLHPNHCGFCFNYCGIDGVCNAGVCEKAP